MKINEAKDLLGRIVWSRREKYGRSVQDIEFAEFVFANIKDYRYIHTIKIEDIVVEHIEEEKLT